MDLEAYFSSVKGTGVLATSDSQGNVDAAIYAKPYIVQKDVIAFSMMQRLSYMNTQSNPKATYVFIENGPGYLGRRLYLTKTSEETNPEMIKQLRKTHNIQTTPTEEIRHMVYFRVENICPLIGDSFEEQ